MLENESETGDVPRQSGYERLLWGGDSWTAAAAAAKSL